jgi:methylamine dehydrogenase light chain
VKRMDGWTIRLARELARRTSRRSALATVGAVLLGGAVAPLLPIARARTSAPRPGEPDASVPEGNPEDCQYWRYCGIDGFLAACCGGSHASCPPGTEMSPITWLGTCRNPADGRQYVVSYNDCCGKSFCGRCFCVRNEGQKPLYDTHRNNDIDWCMGTESVIYNSTVSIVVAVVPEGEGAA